MKKILLTVILVFLAAVVVSAQNREYFARPVTSSYTVGVGSSHIADTYLSQIKYNGWSTSLRYDRWQAMKVDPLSWVMNLSLGVDVERAVNKVGNSAIWYAGIIASWSPMRSWYVAKGLKLGVGPVVNLDLGCLYLNRNSNNPASAKAAFTVGATGFVAYNVSIGRLPVTFLWQPSLPVAGAFFSPEYGELYYEIYLGNHSGLAHFAWWGNYFSLNNTVTADLHFGATALKIGYRGGILSTKANHIVSNHFTHQFIFGISGEWLSINPRKAPSPRAKLYHALYEY